MIAAGRGWVSGGVSCFDQLMACMYVREAAAGRSGAALRAARDCSPTRRALAGVVLPADSRGLDAGVLSAAQAGVMSGALQRSADRMECRDGLGRQVRREGHA